jgi:hypothetical protein
VFSSDDLPQNSDIELNSAVFGSIAAGWIADKIGRKFSFAIAFIFSAVGITLEVVAVTSGVFFAGKFINGVAIGIFIATSFTYVGEVGTQSAYLYALTDGIQCRSLQHPFEAFSAVPRLSLLPLARFL